MNKAQVALGFLTAAIFTPTLADGASSPKWAFLAAVVGVGVFFMPRQVVTLGHVLGGALLLWCGATLFWTPVFFDGAHAAAHAVVLAGLFCLGSQVLCLRSLLIGAALGLALNSAVVVAQVYFNFPWTQTAAPGGLFVNRNLGAEAAALVLVGAIAYRLWWVIPALAPTLYLQSSRGATVAIAVALLAGLYPYARRFVAGTLAVAVIAAALVVILNGTDSSTTERFAIWRDTLDGMTLWGNGLGSFYGLYPSHATRLDVLAQRPEHAHMDTLEMVYEIGAGALLFAVFVGFAFRQQHTAGRMILVAFLVEGVFSFPLHNPFTGAVFTVVAGFMYGGQPPFRSDVAAGRAILRRWLVGEPRLQGSG